MKKQKSGQGVVIHKYPSKKSVKFIREELWEVCESAVKSGRGRLDSDDWLEEDLKEYKLAFDDAVSRLIDKVKSNDEKRLY